MTAWIYITGFGWLALVVAAGFFAKAADRPGDDFGAIAPALLCAAGAVPLFVAWVVLLIVRAW